jgi:CRP-like cAMP-binding protein
MIISEINLFKGINYGVMEEISEICTQNNYVKDEVLFQKDEKAESLYILLEGTLKLVVIKDGGHLTHILSEAGEVFGWSALFEAGKYTASAVCVTDLKVVKIEAKKLDRVFEKHPDAGLKVIKRMGAVISKRLTNAYADLLSAHGTESAPSYG